MTTASPLGEEDPVPLGRGAKGVAVPPGSDERPGEWEDTSYREARMKNREANTGLNSVVSLIRFPLAYTFLAIGFREIVPPLNHSPEGLDEIGA